MFRSLSFSWRPSPASPAAWPATTTTTTTTTTPTEAIAMLTTYYRLLAALARTLINVLDRTPIHRRHYIVRLQRTAFHADLRRQRIPYRWMFKLMTVPTMLDPDAACESCRAPIPYGNVRCPEHGGPPYPTMAPAAREPRTDTCTIPGCTHPVPNNVPLCVEHLAKLGTACQFRRCNHEPCRTTGTCKALTAYRRYL